jgi:hypothetical protein
MNFTCRQLFLLAASLIWCGGLTSCKPVSGGAVGVIEGQKSDGKIGLPCKLPTPASGTDSKQQISLIVDGSASMLGFAKTTGSRYLQIIKLLDSLTLSNAGGVEYARLDDGGKVISRSEFQQAQSVGFYNGKTNRTADMLNGATAKDKSEKLVAIITDLQQDDGDIKLTSKKILDNYLKKPGYAVAVWGFKSEFNDYIYPLHNIPKFPYASKDIATGRPFYLLLVGRHESIVSFAKELRGQAGALFSDAHNQLTIFSPGYATQDVVYLNEPKDLPTGITAPRSLSLNGFAIDDGNQPMAFLEMKDAEKSKIQYSLPWKLTSDLAAPRSLETSTSIVKYDAEQKDFAVDTNLSKGDFRVISKSDDKKIDVDLEINPAGFTRGLYYAKTDLQAIGLQTPTSWDAWDDPTGKNGAKTEGLKDFLGSLGLNASAVMKEKPLTVARLCHGIQKN